MAPKRKPPRILLASGIFYPDVGGPAVHVRHIADHFSSLGWKVTVIAFGNAVKSAEPYRVIRASRKMSKLFSWALYAWHIARETARHDLVYGFDLTTAGLPAAFFARLFGKPFLLRIGGDPIWERIVEKGKRFLPMRAYYEQKLYRVDKPMLYRAIQFVVGSATRVVTYCEFLRDIYVNSYGVPAGRLTIIRNPFPTKHPASPEVGTFTFIFAGRFVSYKNLERVVRVFGRIAGTHPEARLLLIADGPEEKALRILAAPLGEKVIFMPKVGQATLFEKIAGASVALAPAITEFNPNFILESLALGKPALISRDNGLSAQLPSEFQFDSLDDESLHQAMERLLNPTTYRAASETISRLPMDETWDSVVKGHEELVRGVLKI